MKGRSAQADRDLSPTVSSRRSLGCRPELPAGVEPHGGEGGGSGSLGILGERVLTGPPGDVPVDSLLPLRGPEAVAPGAEPGLCREPGSLGGCDSTRDEASGLCGSPCAPGPSGGCRFGMNSGKRAAHGPRAHPTLPPAVTQSLSQCSSPTSVCCALPRGGHLAAAQTGTGGISVLLETSPLLVASF